MNPKFESRFFVPCELKSPQDPSLFCTSWRHKSPEFPPCLCFENLPRPKNPAFRASWTSNISNVQHLCASATSHLQHYFAFGNPNTVAARKWNHLSFWRFSLCRSNFLSNLRPVPVMRPIMVLLVFPLFGRHFGCLWVSPKLTVSFSTPTRKGLCKGKRGPVLSGTNRSELEPRAL